MPLSPPFCCCVRLQLIPYNYTFHVSSHHQTGKHKFHVLHVRSIFESSLANQGESKNHILLAQTGLGSHGLLLPTILIEAHGMVVKGKWSFRVWLGLGVAILLCRLMWWTPCRRRRRPTHLYTHHLYTLSSLETVPLIYIHVHVYTCTLFFLIFLPSTGCCLTAAWNAKQSMFLL